DRALHLGVPPVLSLGPAASLLATPAPDLGLAGDGTQRVREPRGDLGGTVGRQRAADAVVDQLGGAPPGRPAPPPPRRPRPLPASRPDGRRARWARRGAAATPSSGAGRVKRPHPVSPSRAVSACQAPAIGPSPITVSSTGTSARTRATASSSMGTPFTGTSRP